MRAVLLPLLLLSGIAFAEFESLAEANTALASSIDTDPVAAVSALAAIPSLYAKAGEDEQKAVVSTVGKAARSKDLRIRHGAFAALGGMKAKGSSKYLGRWIKPPKSFKGEIEPSYVEAIRAAGQIADTSTLSKIEKLADHREMEIAEAATLALGGFSTLPTKRRKALAFDLVDRLTRLSAKQRRKQNEEVAERKARLAGVTVQALQALTGAQRQTVSGWEAWREKAEREKDPFS